MPIRARWPPENWCGKAAHQRRVETDAVQLLARHNRAAARAATRPCATGASPTMSTTRIRGLSDAYGSWKIICILSCCSRAFAGARPASGAPRQKRSPSVSGSRPTASRPSVDLPQPDSPTRPTTSPGGDREVDAIDGVHDLLPRAGAEQVADLRRGVEALHEALRDAAQFDQRDGGCRARRSHRRSRRGRDRSPLPHRDQRGLEIAREPVGIGERATRASALAARRAVARGAAGLAASAIGGRDVALRIVASRDRQDRDWRECWRRCARTAGCRRGSRRARPSTAHRRSWCRRCTGTDRGRCRPARRVRDTRASGMRLTNSMRAGATPRSSKYRRSASTRSASGEVSSMSRASGTARRISLHAESAAGDTLPGLLRHANVT